MIYADTDFFLALLKGDDRLKNKALGILEKYKGMITTSVITFIELGLVAKRYGLDVFKLFTAVMSICNIEDERIIKAALYMSENLNVFDAFHAAFSEGSIISSDHVFDKVGIKRIRLDD